jgi:DNA-directed RNA polymerase specialized sigma24 family protein
VEGPIGELFRTAEGGNPAAADVLFATLYRELHAIAERQLHRGGTELTLGTTTLLHEAYLNFAGREGVQFATRGQFLAYAARAMRGLMLDYARRHRSLGHLPDLPAGPPPRPSAAGSGVMYGLGWHGSRD